MNPRIIVAALLLAVGSTSLRAAPVSLKELDLMVRMHATDAEILGDLTERRLLTQIDARTEQLLITDGATAGLIARIKAGNFALEPEKAAALQKQTAVQNIIIARQKADDDAAFLQRERMRAAQPAPSDNMLRMLDGKLVRMEDGNLRPVPAGELRKVRYFALYFSALWCGPCRQFTPKLVDFYKQMKAQHSDFEVIFVSNDRSLDGMTSYMQKDEMSWPAIRYDQVASMNQFAQSGIPWLVILNDAGKPIFPKNPAGEGIMPAKWSDPNVTLEVLKALVEHRQTEIRLSSTP